MADQEKPAKKKASQVDLLAFLPPFGTPRQWRTAVTVLFREMAVCIRRQIPITDALDMRARSRRDYEKSKVSLQAWRLRIITFLFCAFILTAIISGVYLILFSLLFVGRVYPGILAIVWMGEIVGLALILSSSIFNGEDAIISFLAEKLSAEMKKGRSLHEAMHVLARYYTPMDIALIQAGEASGRLAEALDRAAEYKDAEAAIPWTPYLIVVQAEILLAVAILYFIMGVGLLDKLSDMLLQIGMEMPLPTMLLMQMMSFVSNNALGIGFVLLFLMIVCFYTSPNTVEGFFLIGMRRRARGGRVLVTIALSLAFLVVLSAIGDLLSIPPPVEKYLRFIIVITAFASASIVEKILYRGRFRGIAEFAENIWIIKYSAQPLRLSRYLYALGTLVRGGIPFSDAAMLAGRATESLRYEQLAGMLADSLSRGTLPEQAIEECVLFSPMMKRTLILALKADHFPETCIELSDDLLYKAANASERTGAVLRAMTSLLAGVIAAVIIISLYLPIFSIAKAVSYYSD